MLCPDSKSAITVQEVNTPIGLCSVEACDRGVHRLTLADGTDQNIDPKFNSKTQSLEFGTAHAADNKKDLLVVTHLKPINQAIQWLSLYFNNPNDLKFTPPVCFPSEKTTDFERKVWTTLAACSPFGTKLSYAELAAKIENPKASRAVGTAMKKNPVPLIIPCHRVIRSDGRLGNYAGGSKVKEWLLDHEQRFSDSK